MAAAREEVFGSAEARVGGASSVERLVAWATAQNGNRSVIASDGIELVLVDEQGTKESSEGEGKEQHCVSAFRATRALETGEEIFSVPPSVLLWSRSEGKWRNHIERLLSGGRRKAKSARTANDFAAKYKQLSERDKLTLRLLLEVRDHASRRNPIPSLLVSLFLPCRPNACRASPERNGSWILDLTRAAFLRFLSFFAASRRRAMGSRATGGRTWRRCRARIRASARGTQSLCR